MQWLYSLFLVVVIIREFPLINPVTSHFMGFKFYGFTDSDGTFEVMVALAQVNFYFIIYIFFSTPIPFVVRLVSPAPKGGILETILQHKFFYLLRYRLI